MKSSVRTFLLAVFAASAFTGAALAEKNPGTTGIPSDSPSEAVDGTEGFGLDSVGTTGRDSGAGLGAFGFAPSDPPAAPGDPSAANHAEDAEAV